MSGRVLTRRALAAVVVLLLALSVAAVGKDSGVITLRLEDSQSAPQATPRSADSRPGANESREQASEAPADQETPPAPDKPAGARATQEHPVIVVPPSKRKLTQPAPMKALSVVLMDATTGQLLYGREPNTRRPNASTTKIMTAILILEKCKMDDWITASKRCCETPYTSIHLKPGEKIRAKDLLIGMMVRSANDAAVAAAEHISGSEAKFSKLMNSKAKEIGCKNTHFVTANGLYAKDHYSSAYDLCLMARYGFQYPLFNEAVRTRRHFLNSRTKNKEDLAVFSHNKFMKSYEGGDGVKSGYVKQAGMCLVGSATRDGWRLVSTVLKSDNAGRDTATIMDYGFGNFEPCVVAPAGAVCAAAPVNRGELEKVPAAPREELRVAVPKTGARVEAKFAMRSLEAPVAKGTKVGKMVAEVDGVETASVDLWATQDVGVSLSATFWKWTRLCGIVIVCLVAGGRYGATFTKGSRRRGRRVKTALRDFNRFR